MAHSIQKPFDIETDQVYAVVAVKLRIALLKTWAIGSDSDGVHKACRSWSGVGGHGEGDRG